jgi:hypothetical protein
MKPSEIYNQSIEKVAEAKFPSLTVPRDRMQIYNSRKANVSLATEYISVMQMLEDNTSIIARLSMNRGEAPIILLSKDHQIQELKRCCNKLNPHTSPSILCKSDTIVL